MPGWVDDAVCWQVYPLGFLAPDRGLDRLEPWLDYLVDLGATTLLLGPVFTSTSHGYDTVDYYRVDPRLGGDVAFDALVRQARQRGVRVLLDGVFNHVGRDFPAFDRAVAAGPGSAEAGLFRLRWSDDGREPDYDHFEGHRGLVTLNHDADEVADLVVDVMGHWLDRGAHGWRLDAAYAVPTRFWARVLPRVRDRHPDAYLLAEVIHGDYVRFVRESGVDAVTQYELWKAIWSALNDRNLHELAWSLGRHDAMLEHFAPLTFVGNHDVTRIATRLREASLVAHALAVLLTVGGTPCVYYGDEQGWQGVKEDRPGGDDAIRTAYPEDPTGLPAAGHPVRDLHARLIRLRRDRPWLHRARTTVEHLGNEQMVYRSAADGQAVVVALNLAAGPVTLPAAGTAAVLAGDGALTGADQVTLPAAGWAVLG